MLDRDALINVSDCCNKAPQHRMAPSPDNDAAVPKAPDKPRHDKPKEKNKDDKMLSDLNDGELKGLLDEALNYKNPKDREGKSKLFNHLLSEAEESERNARAARAGGSERVRYCNPSAKRNSRHRKKPSSISENMMHGGSLDNLAKEELFETSKHRTKKSVSARQREGGSLPCNVNASTVTNLEYQFLEEARRKKEMAESQDKTVNDLETDRLLEHDSLAHEYPEEPPPIEMFPLQAKYTSRATLHVNNVDDPIQLHHLEQNTERKGYLDSRQPSNLYIPSYFNLSRLPDDKKVDENGNALQLKTKKKKVVGDKNVVICKSENVEGHRSDIVNDMDKLLEYIDGEGHHQPVDNQRSQRPTNKSKQMSGRHTTSSLDETTANNNSNNNNATSTTTATTTSTKSKKQRAHSSKSSNNKDNTSSTPPTTTTVVDETEEEKTTTPPPSSNRGKLTKSNSLGEISTTNLDDFGFDDKDAVVLRNNKNNVEKPRERRSWGNMEPLQMTSVYSSNGSTENLSETAEFRVVTKKKKSRKRRSSVNGRSGKSTTVAAPAAASSSSGGGRVGAGMMMSSSSSTATIHMAASTSPRGPLHPHQSSSTDHHIRRKSACSVPHSEKSNDSSDADSVHSLPIDATTTIVVSAANMPISYADMARNNDNRATVKDPKKIIDNKVPKECVVVVVNQTSNNVSNNSVCCDQSTTATTTTTSSLVTSSSSSTNQDIVNLSSVNQINTPPDVHNIKNFPAISGNSNKQSTQPPSSGAVDKTKTSNKTNQKISTMMKVMKIQSSNLIQSDIRALGQQQVDGDLYYSSSLPPDIPDVQTIEKMQMIRQGHPSCYDVTSQRDDAGLPPTTAIQQQSVVVNNNECSGGSSSSVVDCDDNNSERTNSSSNNNNNGSDVRPPVVIMSGVGSNKDVVPDLEFGFDINEQLLSEDDGRKDGFNYDEFAARYVPPENCTSTSHNHDKIVQFIGSAWDDIVNSSDAEYYTES